MKLSDAMEGNDCLIKRAFDLRKKAVNFKCPEELKEDEGIAPDNEPWVGPIVDKAGG